MKAIKTNVVKTMHVNSNDHIRVCFLFLSPLSMSRNESKSLAPQVTVMGAAADVKFKLIIEVGFVYFSF